MVDRMANLEAQRIEALRTRNSSAYRALSNALGYFRNALEDTDLYDSAEGISADLTVPVNRLKKSASVDDLEDSALRAVSMILERFVPRAPKNNSDGDREIALRLGKISRIGYPLSDYSGLNGPQAFQFYLRIKDQVLCALRKRGLR